MFVNESLDKILKPKSKKQIKKDIDSLDVDSKENMVKRLTSDDSHFMNSEEAIEFIESFLTPKELNKVWQTIIDLVDGSGYEELYDDNKRDESIEVTKEWITDNMTFWDILDLMITSLSETHLDMIIDSLYMNESYDNILKPKSKEEVYQNLYNILGEDPKKLLYLLNKYNKGLFIIHLADSSESEIFMYKDPEKVIEQIIKIIADLSGDNYDHNKDLAVCSIDQTLNKGSYYDEGRSRNAYGMIKLLFDFNIRGDSYEGGLEADGEYYVS